MIMKKVSQILLTLLMILSVITNVSAYSRDENSKVVSTVAKIITSYALGMDSEKMLEQLKDISQDDYEIWNDIIDYWDWIEKDMVENTNVPTDLPAENHVFIVLGYALKEDGTMEEELVGRLEVALDVIKKYPNNYLLVTGGVQQNGYTEGQRMYNWLVEQGISKDKIIVETKAEDTAGNATNSFQMLYTEYTDIKSCSLITSQYHLKRGSILYYAESLLKAKELDVEPIEFIGNGNAGWEKENKTEENILVKAFSLSGIAHCTNTIVMNIVRIIVEILFVVILIISVVLKRKRRNI